MAYRRSRNLDFACVLGTLAALVAAACEDVPESTYIPPPLAGVDAGDGASAADVQAPIDVSPQDADTSACTTLFTFAPKGRAVTSLAVTGEWNGFTSGGVPMTGPDAGGEYSARVPLAPGLAAYDLIVDGKAQLDPESAYRKYVRGAEHSAVRVVDCHLPTLSLAGKTITRANAGSGRFEARVDARAGRTGPAIDPSSVKVTLRKDGASTSIASATFDAALGSIAIDVPSLGDGKYTVFVDAADTAGNKAKTLRLVFWIEADSFDWRDAIIYMVMTDRFQDGDPSNNAPKAPGVDTRADYLGGDLQGVRARILDGTLDKLGIRALWLSPFYVNPAGAYAAGDGAHLVTGYHGYWPIKGRGVDPRIGGDGALKDLVTAAHAHGIRVLQDFVVNHVHQDHEYFAQHPEWFRTGCVCGTANCDWDTHRLDCLFASYLPDVNWTVPDVSEQWESDAVWWLDSFDLDGLRVDAVKHVEDACVINVARRIRDEFEAAGTRVFLTGETAMGWSDCGLSCNASQYDAIARSIGPHGLDGQTDFVLYHAASYRVFAQDQKGMLHADYWAQASGWEYPQDAIMTPYIGSQDSPRFITLATYRGQDASHDMSIPGNQWTNAAAAPDSSEPYSRQRIALSWLLGLPGAPLLYYGDEYGEWGGADPNNRSMWRGGALTADEQATLAHVQLLGAARRELAAMRRGQYVPIVATEDTLVFGRRTTAGETAIVALTRAMSPQRVVAPLPITMNIADGTRLRDRMGGADVTVNAGAIAITLGARGTAILAP